MNRRIALRGLLLSTLAVASCGGVAPGTSPTPLNINPASGLYGLTLTMGPECPTLPEAERTRHYSARLTDDGPGRYIVSLSDGTFMQDNSCIPLGCNQFRALEEADTIRFSLEDQEWRGGYITEKAASGTLVIVGEAVGPRHPTLIEASGTGRVAYCANTSAFPCLSPSVSCRPSLKFVFTRK